MSEPTLYQEPDHFPHVPHEDVCTLCGAAPLWVVPVEPGGGLASGIWEYLVTLSPPDADWLDIKDVQRGIWSALGAGIGGDDE